jgi:hypothetical protein
MSKTELPVILAVDDDPDTSGALERDLTRRFWADYRIVVERSAEAGVQKLQHFDVAVIGAGPSLQFRACTSSGEAGSGPVARRWSWASARMLPTSRVRCKPRPWPKRQPSGSKTERS